jgi:hypothetical protein
MQQLQIIIQLIFEAYKPILRPKQKRYKLSHTFSSL